MSVWKQLQQGKEKVVPAKLFKNSIKGASLEKNAEQNEAECLKNNVLYSDPVFLPDKKCLCEDWVLLHPNKANKWRNYEWKRISEIYKGSRIAVFEGIDPNDILQGGLGDCWLLSALSAVAEFDYRIKALFVTKNVSNVGVYEVKICDMGIWRNIIIDDFIPVHPKSNKLTFSGPRLEHGISELWVVLMEKAWAKVYGSYQKLEGGFTKNSLTDLTGAPVDVIETNNPILWENILFGDKKKYIMCCSSLGAQASQDQVDESGLVALHAYSLIDVKEVTYQGQIVKLIHLRNPWGMKEWQGAWGDNDTRWTPELKKECKWIAADDGSFWMCLEDFVTKFSEVSICKMHDNYLTTCRYVGGARRENLIRVNFERTGNAYISVCQRDKRHYSASYEYSTIRLILAREQGNELVFVAGRTFFYERDGWIQFKAQQGSYLCYVEIESGKKFGFQVYSKSKSEFDELSEDFNQVFLNRCYNIELASRSGEGQSTLIGPDMRFYTGARCGSNERDQNYEGFLYDIIENKNTEGKSIWVKIIHKSFDNLALVPPFQGHDYEVTVKPGQVVTIVKKQIDLYKGFDLTLIFKKKIE